MSSASAEHFYSTTFDRNTNIKSDAFHSESLHRDVKYSIYLPPSYFEEPQRRYPVIYYLHGFDIREAGYQDWLNWYVDEALDDLIASGRVCEMIVVMPDCFATGIVVNWGRYSTPTPVAVITFPFRFLCGTARTIADPTYFGSYLFIHRFDLVRADYADFFVSEFIPHIEQNYRIRRGRESRALCGFSTGGYSTLSLAFQNPGMFDSVSAHAPMLVIGSPFSPNAKELFVEFDFDEHQFVTQRFKINLFRRIFVDEQTWKANDPLELARHQNLGGLSVYIDVADNDKRKYDVGAKALVAILRERGVPVQFELVKGLPVVSGHTYPGFLNGKLVARHSQGLSNSELYRKHGWENLRVLIDPDVHRIDDSLQFHSREFSDGCASN